MMYWELIFQLKQTQINRDNARQNKHRIDYDYKVGEKVTITNHTAYKYETPYKGPFVATQCFTNDTVMLQYGPKQLSIIYVEISHMNWILKLKILSRKICLMV